MVYSNVKSFAKINLSLNVTGKFKNYHKIESIISFLDLYDLILIKKIKSKNHKIRFIGQFSKNINKSNTISKLLNLLDKKKLLKDIKFEIIVQKNIPSKAGLGGGSMNAASVLKYFIKKKFVKISKNEISKITYLIGSDVILGMYSSKFLILKSNKKIFEFLSKKKFYTLLVKPNFGCSTKKIYSGIKKFRKTKLDKLKKIILEPKFLSKMSNDLEAIAFKKYPKLNRLKSFLEKMSQVDFVRMSGSGSTIIAYFSSARMCKEAEKKVRKEFRNYWFKISKTI
tara:strand:- start:74 stop:922 length:849 start_codon:yes stop_codon:yes gene_type:complete